MTDTIPFLKLTNEGAHKILSAAVAKAAEVPIVVAINKMDLPGADPERVKRQLSEQESGQLIVRS